MLDRRCNRIEMENFVSAAGLSIEICFLHSSADHFRLIKSNQSDTKLDQIDD